MGVRWKKRMAKQEPQAVLRNNQLLKRKKVIILAALLLLAGAVTGTAVVLAKKNNASQLQIDSKILETTAVIGEISNTVVGTGNLEADTAVSAKIPSGLVMDEIKVESGDYVEKGDILAVVNEASVLSAMEEAQASIDAFDEEIRELQENETEEEVTAKVSGRIKKIYVETGDDAGDAMAAHGAVMLLSADGMLAVSVETEAAASKGDAVTVTRTDGSVKTGAVESADGKTCVVTFSDYGVGMGETVAVTDSKGMSLGNGITYIHQEIQVTVTGGTVESICVAEDEAVASDDILLVLEGDGQSVKEKELTARREAMAATLQKLAAIAKTGTITADMDGTIADVNVSEGSSSGSSAVDSTSGGSTVQRTSTSRSGQAEQKGTSEGGAVQAVSALTCSAIEHMGMTTVSFSKQETQDNLKGEAAEASDETGAENEQGQQEQLYFAVKSSGISTSDSVTVELPQTDAVLQDVILARDGSYSGTVTWNPADSVFAAETVYQAEVALYASDGYCFGADSVLSVEDGVISGITAAQDGSSICFRITFPQTAKKQSKEDVDKTGQDSSGEGDTSGGEFTMENVESGNSQNDSDTVNSGEGTTDTENADTSGNSGSAGDSGTENADSSSQGTAAESVNESSSDNDTLSSLEYSTDITAFTISANNTMLLLVSVDELDINSISVDQEAEVSLDALEDQIFYGTVTEVGNTASASGGVAKYTVKIQIPKEEEMKEGMNASATIVIEKKENVVTIPVNALQERGKETFVYMEKDANGNLSGETEVTTGLSDGDVVEITKGLADGDTVYYQKTGNVNSSAGSQGGMLEGGFGSGEQGEMPGSGEMPGGGSMPSKGGMPSGGGGMG